MNKEGIPVLMYHALEDEQNPAGAKDPGEQLYIVPVANFWKQMEYLHSSGFQTCLLEELFTQKVWPDKSIVITFDDGHESNYTLALPILQEFGFKAEFFITTGWIGTTHFLKPNQIVELHKVGMGIGSHSVSHPYFNDLSDKEIEKELQESKTTLEEILETEITSFSAPGGRLPETHKGNGYKFLYTSQPGIFKKGDSVLKIPRFAIKDHISNKEFSNIVNLCFSSIAKIQIKNTLLYCSKKVLGNKTYETIRNFALANKTT